MKKYENRGYRYSTFVAEAVHNAEAKGYLQWLVKTYGKDVDTPCDTQATDFARFRLRLTATRELDAPNVRASCRKADNRLYYRFAAAISPQEGV